MAKFNGFPLFIAVPELIYNVKLLDILRGKGLINELEYDNARDLSRASSKAQRLIAEAMEQDTLIGRLLAVGSDEVTVETVNILRSAGLLTPAQGHALRQAIRTLAVAQRGGIPTSKAAILERLYNVLNAQASRENVDLLVSLDIISSGEAERFRGELRARRVILDAVKRARRAKSLTDALMVLGDYEVTRDAIEGLIKAKILNPRVGKVYNALIDLGVKQWRVFEGVRAAEGWRARALMGLSGSINQQLLDFLLQTGSISQLQYQNLQILEIIGRNVNDNLLESVTKRRYRVKPGQAPIKTFARSTRVDDDAILRLLAQAAREASKEAEALAGRKGIGAATRSAQYRLSARALHETMRNMWDGVGYLTIRGESRAAEAAAESISALQAKLLKRLPPAYSQSILYQAKAGVDSYVSREENTLRLSRLVYKNAALYQGKVDTLIKIGLLRGQSAEEIARAVSKYIRPDVPGGVAYAAKRLARTEINNAFHYSQIRYTREQPWIRGYKWNNSGSHKHTDVCDQYARNDHDDLGPGVFKKSNVPGKPHPQCLCYLTTVQMDEDQFVAAYRAGRFKAYLKTVERGESLGKDSRDSRNLDGYLRTGVRFSVSL